MRILSGIQPSGSLHLGNYFAMMAPMIKAQKEHELLCIIVNYHALTTTTNPNILRENTINACLDFLALGLDPNRSIFFIQSDRSEVCELTWILNNHCSINLLKNAHSYKDKIAKKNLPHNGLFSYPVLMTADILLYQANLVPIGKDQKQHLEIARDIAANFNYIYGNTFVLPEALIDEKFCIIPGIDGQKMSKSYGNTINIFSSEKILKKQIMNIVTNSIPINAPKDPNNCTIYTLMSLFINEKEQKDLNELYKNGGLSYAKLKKDLFARIWEYFEPYRKERIKLSNNLNYIYEVLKKGANKAYLIAYKNLKIIKKRVGLTYNLL